MTAISRIPGQSVLTDAQLQALVADDVPHGDLTTEMLGIGERSGQIVFRARSAMTLCGSEEAARMMQLGGATVTHCLASGSAAEANETVITATGSVAQLHRVWKVAQTLVEYASGIATATARIVDALHAAGFDMPVACTRKNFPGTKAIAAKAVVAGGGVMHRLGLSETLLVFPEHTIFLDEGTLEASLAALRWRCPERKLVAEAKSLEEAIRLAASGVEVLQLEKFSPSELARCVEALKVAGLGPLVAAAGGVNAANAVDYARAGAKLLVTSAPYFAGPVDIAVSLVSAGH